MTSPNATASATVPALAFGPALATRSFSESGLREENITGWPSLANSVPSAPPSRPAPIVAILSLAPVAWARAARGDTAASPSASPPSASPKKSRRSSDIAFVMTCSLESKKHCGRR